MTTAADEIVDAEWVEVTSEKLRPPTRRKPVKLRATPTPGSGSSKRLATPSSPSRSSTKKKTKAAKQSLEKSRAAQPSANPCPLCGIGVGSVAVQLGPLVVKVCSKCADPIFNMVGLLDWWSKR